MTKTDLIDDDTTIATQPKGRFSSATSRVRGTASSARDRASEAYRSARERTSNVRRRTTDGIGSNPVGAVVGALAVGGLIAALLPKTRREVETLGAAGARLTDKAREAAKSATDAGREKLDELGYAAVKQKIGEIVGGKKSEA
ncbi:hypothetical protein IC614_03910 [Allosphingosinicella flava]|uniref:YtxH domain-containing protein n=1 Tax=Allosphingosinicella flava TaxID=2771430 RepID=A0A7T2GKX2_9SPHN|nr:hypothetical protein [Sphingosinicella flava]QPQ55744.1 hypothetical protein IC614_03910 [Sphingosinicella flava]